MMNTKSGTQLAESLPPQHLGEDVRQLLLRPDGLKLNPVLLNTLSNVVEFDINVLTAIVEHRVPAECNGGFVVDLQ
jgi:hypothetical protein